MRIAFIVGVFPAFSETFVLRQVESLLASGHDVVVFSGSAATAADLAAVKPDRSLLARVRYLNRRPQRWSARPVRALTSFPRFLSHSPSSCLRSLNVLQFGREALSLALFFQAQVFSREAPFDAVVAHFGPNGLVGARMLEVGALQGRLFCFFHAFDLTSHVALTSHDVYRPVFQRAVMALAISARGRQQLLELGCAREKVQVLHMGVDPEVQLFRPRDLRRGRPCMLLSVARLVEKKGIANGIDAVQRLVSQGIDLRYRVIGDGPLREALHAQVTRLGLQARVELAGAQSQSEVRRAMDAADLLLFPSTTASNGDEEGIPVVLMEALALGLPVVASASGAVNELVIDGTTGVLLANNTAESLADGILMQLRDPERAARMCRNGRDLVEKDYNTRILAPALEHLLRTAR